MNDSEVSAALSRVRVTIDWSRIDRSKLSVRACSDKSEIELLYTAWYADGAAVERSFDASGVRPVTVGEVAREVERWGAKRDAILRYEEEFRRLSPSVLLPVYRLSAERFLLLDGNHRAVALARASVSFDSTLIIVDGPLDPTILPDLVHWTH